MNPFKVVEDFEKAVAEYTSAPYCVAVNSCTNALFLCLMWQKLPIIATNKEQLNINTELVNSVTIPKRTYIGVAQSIKNAGFQVRFSDEEWRGIYQLHPFCIWDAAKRFRAGMFTEINFVSDIQPTDYVCTSHHWQKILGIQQGGCILHNDKDADAWFRKARFDGRTAGQGAALETQPIRGWHMYMSPEVAAEGLVRLHHLPRDNADLPTDNYPDLSQMEIFQNE